MSSVYLGLGIQIFPSPRLVANQGWRAVFALQYNWEGEKEMDSYFFPQEYLHVKVNAMKLAEIWIRLFDFSFHAANPNPNPHIDVGSDRIKLITLMNSPRWTWAIVLYGWHALLPSKL